MTELDTHGVEQLIERIELDRQRLAHEVRVDVALKDRTVVIGQLEPMGSEWNEYIKAILDDDATKEHRTEVCQRLLLADIQKVTTYEKENQ